VAIVTASSPPARAPHSFFDPLLKLLCGAALALLLAGCGGGGSGSPVAMDTVSMSGPNVLAITVDRGTDGTAINVPFVSVTVCQPGTDNCLTVDHVVVDTGSFGLRLKASAIGPGLAALPPVVDAAGSAVGECAQFASGRVWGSVRRADVRLAGERAAGMAIQVVSDPAEPFATVPASCSAIGPDVGVGSGSNGILGVGMLAQDCGGACTVSTAPGVYFACPASGCAGTTLPLASQVTNPVAAFATNNNGVAVVLPPVPAGGASRLAGSLIFGVDTQANNQLGAATAFLANGQGNFTTTYNGVSFTSSFIDSGSNAIFFPDASIPECSGFYCPPAPLTLSAVNTSATGVSGTVSFTIESIVGLASTAAAANIGADIGFTRTFDWGLPFFFGRTVFVAMRGAVTSKGPGPLWAY
jgi:hypothetical protein